METQIWIGKRKESTIGTKIRTKADKCFNFDLKMGKSESSGTIFFIIYPKTYYYVHFIESWNLICMSWHLISLCKSFTSILFGNLIRS